jgi:endonuclease YncB( thermonuclease family)
MAKIGKKKLRILLLLGVGSVLCWWVFFAGKPAQGQAQSLAVERVIDGNTLVVRRGGDSLKLLLDGVDAPELAQPGGRQARDALASLAGEACRVVFLASEPDRWGRFRADLYAGKTEDVWVQGTLARSGWVWAHPDTADRELTSLVKMARSERRGIWQSQSPQPPWQWRRNLHAGANGK